MHIYLCTLASRLLRLLHLPSLHLRHRQDQSTTDRPSRPNTASTQITITHTLYIARGHPQAERTHSTIDDLAPTARRPRIGRVGEDARNSGIDDTIRRGSQCIRSPAMACPGRLCVVDPELVTLAYTVRSRLGFHITES